MFNKSWKTTAAGSLAAAGAYLQTVPGYEKYGVALMGASIFLMGFCARDKNVSTEQQAGVSPALIAACKDAGIKP
jgi:hypothetical protein